MPAAPHRSSAESDHSHGNLDTVPKIRRVFFEPHPSPVYKTGNGGELIGFHFLGRKDFLPVEPPPQADLSFLFLLGDASPKTTHSLIVSGFARMSLPPQRPFLAQEYRLRLKQPAPTLSPSLGGPLYLNPQPVSFLAALALPGLLSRRSASASLSARKICLSYFSRSKANSKILPPNPPRLTVPRSRSVWLPTVRKRWTPWSTLGSASP